MPYNVLIEAIRSTPRFEELAGALPRGRETVAVPGLAGSAPQLLLAGLHEARPERLWVIVAGSPDEGEHIASDLETLLGEGAVSIYPQREALPYEPMETHVEIGGLRVEALESVIAGRASILVTTTRALQERSPAITGIADLQLDLRVGQTIRPRDLAERLKAMGFERMGTVEEVGQFALRGGILDVFGFGSPEPARIEFWGDEIESIRPFDVLTQLSVGDSESIRLLPVDVSFAPGNDPSAAGARRSLLEYLPPEAILVWNDTAAEHEWARGWAEVVRLYQAEARSGGAPDPPERLYHSPEEIARLAHGFPALRIGATTAADRHVGFRSSPPEPIERDMLRLGELLRAGAAAGERTLILCDNTGQIERLQELLDELGVSAGATLAIGSLTGGFVLEDAQPPLRVLTDHEIFRRTRRLRRRRQFRGGATIESFAALQPGEYVVHMDHGIGRFRGMEQVRVGEEIFETLVIEYAGGEVLRVPVHRLDLIERWTADSDRGAPPRVHRIGGKDWSRTKSKAKRAIEEMTSELLELYAAREAAEGFEFSPDTRWQREMESAFLFEDTPDQRQATDDVKRDMEARRPMDRLICGDVGYGKTEIAIRAAFKAVQDGKQVAVLVPTTILAEQHLRSFSERLAGFPITIESISRFRTPKEQREVLTKLQAGEVDIVVGTHRLLSPDVEFRDLGLLVVDEEQRFGVKHKERLKQLKRSVDVLTLTATPIPRTLHFSLLGIRDMTLIQTPPRDRQPIITHVLPWSDAVISDAITRELDRGGQVFFVHNRIETIGTVAQRVDALVEDARIGIAHGQMAERELDDVMRRFLAGEINVLVATSIIESGLDVPNANTLIVDRADQFGLAQLYQIRGRVGRSHHRAYCYLLIPENVSEDAEKRLKVLEHYTELGSGYGIAMKDLELRGAGNILGSAQSGMVHSVGLDTYMRLLEQTVREMKGEGAEAKPRIAEVSVDGAALIPDDYIADEQQKLHFYRRLSNAKQVSDVDAVRRELRDRFGPIPEAAETLLATAALRLLASEIGIERLLARPWDARVNFRRGVVPPMAALQHAFAEWQLEADVHRPIPLSLVLHRRGTEPMERALIGALQTITRDRSMAA